MDRTCPDTRPWSSCSRHPPLEQMIPDLAGSTGTQFAPQRRQWRQRLAFGAFDVDAGPGRKQAGLERGRGRSQCTGAEWRVEKHNVETMGFGGGQIAPRLRAEHLADD